MRKNSPHLCSACDAVRDKMGSNVTFLPKIIEIEQHWVKLLEIKIL